MSNEFLVTIHYANGDTYRHPEGFISRRGADNWAAKHLKHGDTYSVRMVATRDDNGRRR
jgi:hypothetical protein